MLEIKNLVCGYDKIDIIKNVSFNANYGEKICIIGPNGCGKTTMLRAISNLIEYKGNVLLDNEEVKKMPRKKGASKIALMTQTTNIYFPYSVFEIVSFGRYSKTKGNLTRLNGEDVDIVLKAIEDVGLLEEKDKLISNLSGGQFQRAFLAKAFAQDPDILLLDEPTNHLDIKCQFDFLDQLHRWTDNKNKTVITVVHDLNLGAEFATKALMLKNGENVFYGDMNQVMHSSQLEYVYGVDVKKIMQNALTKWEDK